MEAVYVEEVEKIYNLLGDDLSKYIFANRFMFSMTKDNKYMENVVHTIKEVREIHIKLKENEKIVGIFGAGTAGRYLAETFSDIEFECYIDNKCAGNICRGLPVIALSEFKAKYPEGVVLISSRVFYREILQQLLAEGFKEENIINVGKMSESLRCSQYFDLPQLKERRLQKEIFVDGGCFDGDTSVGFYNWCSGQGKVYAWEPDPVNFEQCEKLFQANSIPYQLIPKGLWSGAKELKFRIDKGCSTITEKDWNVKIEVDSIDQVIKEPVTFIKMDIEGAEYEALSGASKMIMQYKPKLAISVYHKPEDIWKLPLLIHELNQEYIFYLRHYSFSWSETVLYAV